MTTNSSPLALSRVSKAWSFCAISFARLLNFQQKIDNLLVFCKSLLWGQCERLLDKRHVDAGVHSCTPGRARVRRANVLAVYLRQCLFVNHRSRSFRISLMNADHVAFGVENESHVADGRGEGLHFEFSAL